MIAAIQRTLVGRTLAAIAALAILVGGWHAATAHGVSPVHGAAAALAADRHAHDHGHAHEHAGEDAHAPDAASDATDASHASHDRIDHEHPQSLATARRVNAAPAGTMRLAVAHQGSPPQRSDAPFRPPRG